MEEMEMEESEGREYKEKLVEMINSTEDAEFLIFTYRFVKRLKENWGV